MEPVCEKFPAIQFLKKDQATRGSGTSDFEFDYYHEGTSKGKIQSIHTEPRLDLGTFAKSQPMENIKPTTFGGKSLTVYGIRHKTHNIKRNSGCFELRKASHSASMQQCLSYMKVWLCDHLSSLLLAVTSDGILLVTNNPMIQYVCVPAT